MELGSRLGMKPPPERAHTYRYQENCRDNQRIPECKCSFASDSRCRGQIRLWNNRSAGFSVALEPFEVSADVRRVLIAHIGILFERLADDLFELQWQLGIDLRRRHGRVMQNCAHDRPGSLALKR